jgi:adenylosuccinate synthase
MSTPIAVMGAQWGDEGKGKIVDLLSKDHDLVVRYQGGNNAGHTVQIGEHTHKLHLVPSGMLSGKECVLGNGTVIEPRALLDELQALPPACDRSLLRISERAHVVLCTHALLDWAAEQGSGIGTTKKGIGPAYTSKAARFGAVRMCELANERLLAEMFTRELPRVVRELMGLADHAELQRKVAMEYPGCHDGEHLLSPAKMARYYALLGRQLTSHLANTSDIVNGTIAQGKRVLFEGAQGAMLDVDHGTYPYVTSSSTTRGGVFTGSGYNGSAGLYVLGVTKAYTTRVGAGPFPTELHDAHGDALCERGHEFGTTTGRKRRCGWLDIPALRYAHGINGFDALALMKLDVLSGMEKVRVCTGYTHKGKAASAFPATTADLEMMKPVYEDLQGWKEDITGVRSFEDLPAACRSYVERIEQLIGVPVSLVSVGPERSQTIVRASIGGERI